jgi:hypothetical protein
VSSSTASASASATDRGWPIIYAAMRQAGEHADPDLATAAARLLVAREAAAAARFTYESLRAHVGRRVGIPDVDEEGGGP